MVTKKEMEEMINILARKHTSSQLERYKDSIFLPYITLPNAKGKGAMMEEFFEWYLNQHGINVKLIKTNENYDFLLDGKIKIELKVASIGYNDIVVFNQLHYGEDRKVDKFLFAIIKPDNDIDFFVIDKKDFQDGKIKLQRQHGSSKASCARLYTTYPKVLNDLQSYNITVDKMLDKLI